jgi:hypothetical protein
MLTIVAKTHHGVAVMRQCLGFHQMVAECLTSRHQILSNLTWDFFTIFTERSKVFMKILAPGTTIAKAISSIPGSFNTVALKRFLAFSAAVFTNHNDAVIRLFLALIGDAAGAIACLWLTRVSNDLYADVIDFFKVLYNSLNEQVQLFRDKIIEHINRSKSPPASPVVCTTRAPVREVLGAKGLPFTGDREDDV